MLSGGFCDQPRLSSASRAVDCGGHRRVRRSRRDVSCRCVTPSLCPEHACPDHGRPGDLDGFEHRAGGDAAPSAVASAPEAPAPVESTATQVTSAVGSTASAPAAAPVEQTVQSGAAAVSKATAPVTQTVQTTVEHAASTATKAAPPVAASSPKQTPPVAPATGAARTVATKASAGLPAARREAAVPRKPKVRPAARKHALPLPSPRQDHSAVSSFVSALLSSAAPHAATRAAQAPAVPKRDAPAPQPVRRTGRPSARSRAAAAASRSSSRSFLLSSWPPRTRAVGSGPPWLSGSRR